MKETGQDMQMTASARAWLTARLGRMSGQLLGGVCVVLVALLGFGPVAQAQSYNFTAVQVEGNVRVDQTTILSFAKLVRGQAISAAALNDAYQRIVASGLFDTVELQPKGGTLVIKVTELPMIDPH